MFDFNQNADIQISEVVAARLTDFDHLIRDLQQAVVLSGVRNEQLERKLMTVREAIEVAASSVREAQ